MPETTPNARLEAFSDGVFAIAMTLLVLDIKIPSADIHTSEEMWHALYHIAPSILTFVLSFTIILITWVNHHAGMKLVTKATPAAIYANGFLLLVVVFLPFPTALLGDTLFTDHASPAVIVFSGLMTIQTVAWILLLSAALKGKMAKSEAAERAIRQNRRYGMYGFFVYATAVVLAVWHPLVVAIATIVIWIFWLIVGITMAGE